MSGKEVDEFLCPFTFNMQGISKISGQPMGSVQKCLTNKCGLYDWKGRACSFVSLCETLRRILFEFLKVK